MGNDHNIKLDFEGYEVRYLNQLDTPAFFNLLEQNKSRLNFFSGLLAQTMTISQTDLFVSKSLEMFSRREYFSFLITHISSQSLVGYLCVKNVDWSVPKAELAYFIDKGHTGKGIMKKALIAITTHLFNDLHFAKFFLRTHKDNEASRNLATKCGFEYEGTIKSDYRTYSGEIVDLLYYGKTNGLN